MVVNTLPTIPKNQVFGSSLFLTTCLVNQGHSFFSLLAQYGG